MEKLSEHVTCVGTPCDCSLCKPMTLADFQASIDRTYKPEHSACHALGLSGELTEVGEHLDALRIAGSIADAVKKDVYHGKPLDKAKLCKELGDTLWYITALANDYGLTLDEIAQGNIDKLAARYPNGFEKGGGVREYTPEEQRKVDLVKGLLERAAAAMVESADKALDKAEAEWANEGKLPYIPSFGDCHTRECARPEGHSGSHRRSDGSVF